jgi:hypothetical protein
MSHHRPVSVARMAWAAEAAPVEALRVPMRALRFLTTCIMFRKPYIAALGSRSVIALEVCSTASLAALKDLTLIVSTGRARLLWLWATLIAAEAWAALAPALCAEAAASPKPDTVTRYSSSMCFDIIGTPKMDPF